MNRENKIEAFILAGGQSSRMGSEKGLVMWKGKPFIEHIIASLENEVAKTTIITNGNAYNYLGLPVQADLVKGKGPLGGIYTGIKVSESEKNFFISCDVPCIKPDAIRFFLNASGNNDATVTSHNGQVEPLPGVYAKNCLPLFERLLGADKTGIASALKYLNVNYVDPRNEPFYQQKQLANINSKEELELLEKDHER